VVLQLSFAASAFEISRQRGGGSITSSFRHANHSYKCKTLRRAVGDGGLQMLWRALDSPVVAEVVDNCA
jgi:hypothetical protein